MKNKMIPPTGIFAILVVALIAGVANATPTQKIVGGTEAALGEFPYQISMRFKGEHLCGGTIVSPRHIITAAHCVEGMSPWRLRIATSTIASTGGQLHSVSTIVSHPDYDPRINGSSHDIAIITLTANMHFNKNQNKLNLPTAPIPSGVIAIATGWGLINANEKDISPKLMKIKVKTLSTTECQKRWGSDTSIYQYQICAYTGPGFGTCMGDSGGPLAYNGQLIGVVSYGRPCGVGYPDVFTSTHHHLSWINRHIKKY